MKAPSHVCFMGLVLSMVPVSVFAESILIPDIQGQWWQVAQQPDLGALTGPGQEPVDFGVWQATDGTWQLWSCIRKTKETGTGLGLSIVRRLVSDFEGKIEILSEIGKGTTIRVSFPSTE